MLPENNISVAASILGSVYLCATSLKQINKHPLDVSLTSMCNYYIFGFSIGMIMYMTKRND